MSKRICQAATVATIWAVLFGVCAAQTITGAISGAVRDTTGGVLPGVTIIVKNVDTGLVRTLATDAEGRYHAPNLPLGNFEVQAELSGFQTAVRSGIKLTIAREAIVDFAMGVGEIAEKLTVTGEAPLVDTTSSGVTGLVDDKQIRDLPLNGRSFEQLATLQNAVAIARGAGSGFDSGQTQKITVAGARPNLNRFLLDGSDVNDLRQKTPGSAAGVFLGVETVREFKVLTSTYSAEYGATAGAIITAVTKSGTNDLKGSLFWFHRNDNLDARNFFDPGPNPPEFKRNQFGFTAGGPIVKNKTFFFGSYEGLRQRLTLTRIWNVFSNDARRGLLLNRTTGALELVGVNPNVRPWLDAYPAPNGRDFGDGVAEYVTPVRQPTGEDYAMIKIDHQFSGDDSIFGRYTISDGDSHQAGVHPVNPNEILTRNQYLTLEHTHIFSPRWLSVSRFGYNRSRMFFTSTPLVELPTSAELVPGKPLLLSGSVSARGGPVALGTESRAPIDNVYNLFEASTDLTFTGGRHSVKAGVLVKRLRFDTDTPRIAGGSLGFASVRDFLLGVPETFRAPLPGKDDSLRNIRQWVLGVYAQDNLKARSNLTLNLGLRYELSTGPTEVNGKLANMRPGESEFTIVNPLFPTPSRLNFAPRVGLAWDPYGDGKTSVQGGYGIYYSANFPAEWEAATREGPFYTLAVINRPTIPVWDFFTRGAESPLPEPQTIEVPNVETMMQWNLNVQRQIAGDTVVSVGYAGSRGLHWFRNLQVNINRFSIVDGEKVYQPGTRNPRLGDHKHIVGDGNAFYHGLLLSLNKRFSRGMQFQGSYTLSKNINDADSIFNREVNNAPPGVQDPLDRTGHRGLSGFDVRQNFVGNFSVDLPFGPGRALGGQLTGIIGKLTEGWQVNGIVTLASGHPFSITSTFNRSNSGTTSSIGSILTERPDLRSGFSNNPVSGTSEGCPGVAAGTPLGTPDRYYDPCAFALQPAGTYGNLGRNTLVGPGYTSVDFALVKNTGFRSVSDDLGLQFRWEVFNVLNRANFGLPTREIFRTAAGVPAGDAGRITSTVGTSRQMQFALKILF